ncbi:MAG: aminotransferase class V-fold PLP-dependent enzyme [Sneathiellaceae bacterium]
MSEAELGGWRADTPGLRTPGPGGRPMIHLNACGAALMPRPVVERVKAHLDLEARTGGYEAQDAMQAELAAAYDSVARLLNARPGEIAFVENATRAWDMAFHALPLGAGDVVLTSVAEYASNYIAFLQMRRRRGIEIRVVPDDSMGALDVAALRRMLDPRVRLIAVTHVPTNGGLVNPAAEIGAVAQAAGIPFLLDACQSVGQMPVDVAAIGCTMLSATGRKFLRGPRGTGFLYVRQDWVRRLEPPFLDLHAAHWTGPDSFEIAGDATRFENWEADIAGRLGLKTAVDYALAIGLSRIADRIAGLADRLRTGLAALPGITVQDKGAVRCGIVAFTSAGLEPAALVHRLRAAGIHVTVSAASSTRLDMDGRGLQACARAGLHYYNSEAEIDACLAAIAAL